MSINKVQKEDDSQKLKKDSENHLEQREDLPQKWDKHWEEFLKNNTKEANMGKMYVEPSGYFTESMKKILEEGENKKSPKTKKRITIDDKEISRIALDKDVPKKTNKKH